MLAIPKIENPKEYTNNAFQPCPFVEILNNEYFDVQMQYPLQKLKNAESTCYVRKEVYDRLIAAAKTLPTGFKFRILDGWRPFLLQQELYNKYSEQIKSNLNLKQYPESEAKEIIRNFVSEPIYNEILPPVHTTGGAVDLTIIDADGITLDMGTQFDSFSPKSYTSYYENTANYLVRDNRRLLYNTMIQAGFTNLPSEWWHYDYGDRFWGYYKQQPVMYKGIFTRKELNEEEKR